MPRNFVDDAIAKVSWDRGGVMSSAIRNGYGVPSIVAELLGVTETEMWNKYPMFQKAIEETMRLEREKTLRIFNSAFNTAILNWIYEATGETKPSDGILFELIRDHLACILRGNINADKVVCLEGKKSSA